MTLKELEDNKDESLFPSIRLVSLNQEQRFETPLCILDPPIQLCIPDPPIPLCPCVANFNRCYLVSCTCDCVDCGCDIYVKPCVCEAFRSCYCDSKGGISPDSGLPPDPCTVHARTFFRLAKG